LRWEAGPAGRLALKQPLSARPRLGRAPPPLRPHHCACQTQSHWPAATPPPPPPPPAKHAQITRATDFFGPALLTHLLLPSLARAAPSRVVNVSSLGEAVGALEWGDLR
jgi:NAD(P)-dependent dehydrogenase (short-subunit alcohol dehydrogenase family)